MFVAILAVPISLYVALRDPYIQTLSARIVANYLSKELKTEIRVNSFKLGFDLTLTLNGFLVNDQQGKVLLQAKSARFSLHNLKPTNLLQINVVDLHDVEINLVKYKGADGLNFQFIADYFNTETNDTTTSNPIEYQLKKLKLSNCKFRYWDQNAANDSIVGIDYSNLNLDNLYLQASSIKLKGDSVAGKINLFRVHEKSGFEIDRLKGTIALCSKGLSASGLQIETEKSNLKLDLQLKYNQFTDFNYFIDSVKVEANIETSTLYMADIGYFAPVMFEMPNSISIAGGIHGFVRDFYADNFYFDFGNTTSFNGSFVFKGLPDFFQTKIEMKIEKFVTNASDIGMFSLPIASRYIELPKNIADIGTIDINGTFIGKYNDFLAKSFIRTNNGHIQSDLALRTNQWNGETSYKGRVITRNLNLGKLLNADTILGKLNMNISIDGSGVSIETAQANIIGNVASIDFMNNTLNDINIDGNLTNQTFNGNFSIDDPKLRFDFKGLVDFNNTLPVFDFSANIKHADLFKLNLLHADTVQTFKGLLNAKFTGLSVDRFQGDINVNQSWFTDSRGKYGLNGLQLTLTEDANLNRKLILTSDFLDFELGGKFKFVDLEESFRRFISSYMAFEATAGKQKTVSSQNLSFSLRLKNTETLSRLLAPNLLIADNTRLSGVYTSENNSLDATFICDWMNVSGVRLQNPNLIIKTDQSLAAIKFQMRDLLFRESNPEDSTEFGVENPQFQFDIRNDSILYQVSWFNARSETVNKGDVQGYYFLNPNKMGELHIQNANLVINDTLWNIEKNNRMLITKDFTKIENLRFFSAKSALNLQGNLPFKELDTLSVTFNNWDLSNFDVLSRSYRFDLDGTVNGELALANLSKHPSFFSNLSVSGLHLNKELIGDARLLSSWSNVEESIYLNAQIINSGNIGTSRIVNLSGFYYPTREKDNIRFELVLDNFKVNLINQFLIDIVSNLQGLASGSVSITGELNKPKMQGFVNLSRTAFKIDYLNVLFSLQHTFEIKPDEVLINNLVLYDSIGNKALVNGKLTHNYLRDFNVKLRIKPNDLLALNTGSQQNELFYGSAFVTGEVIINGPFDDIEMDIQAMSQKGTNLVISLNTNSSIGSNDYITFVKAKNTDSIQKAVETRIAPSISKFGLNLNAFVTPDATLKIFLPYDVGNLETKGTGNISMGVSASGDLSLNGAYVVKSGAFVFAMENLPKKRFDLIDGGVITWTGDPIDAEIDVKGIYRVKASLSGLGLDTTSSIRNRVNVDCIIHLKKQLVNPEMKFSFRFPGSDPQLEQMVFSTLDTTNDAMMTQQMISLLVLNSFSFNRVNSFSIGNSSIDMISNQLSGLLSQISKDFDIGLHYRPGDKISNEELQVALSTQFFNDRISIDGNFDIINEGSTAKNASNLVGDFNLNAKITSDGRLSLTAYRHSNSNFWHTSSLFDNFAPYTQGIGISYREEFNQFADIFRKRKKTKTTPP